jgi:hypothetical protein
MQKRQNIKQFSALMPESRRNLSVDNVLSSETEQNNRTDTMGKKGKKSRKGAAKAKEKTSALPSTPNLQVSEQPNSTGITDMSDDEFMCAQFRKIAFLSCGQCLHGSVPWSLMMQIAGMDTFMTNIHVLDGAEIAAAMMIEAPEEGLDMHLVIALASMGTNISLSPFFMSDEIANGFLYTRIIAETIQAFEAWAWPQGSDIEDNKSVRKLLKLRRKLDSHLKLIKFFNDRIPCDCLKQKLEETKGNNKCMCYNCGGFKDDKELLDCSACGLVKYCGKACQDEDWESHKLMCREFRKSTLKACKVALDRKVAMDTK